MKQLQQETDLALVILVLATCIMHSHGQNETVSSLLEQIFNGYDKKVPPNQDKAVAERQVLVTVNMYINSMFSISEMHMDYSMSMFLRERWVDDRLKYNNTLDLSRLVLDHSLFDNVWMPDMYILNEKESSFHEVTVTNKLMHVYPDGTVQYSARVTGTFSCLMHLQKYPFDRQLCKFEVESYPSGTFLVTDGFSTEDLKFVWSDNAVTMAMDIQFPQFTLDKISSYSCEKDYYGIIYPCIGVKFDLKRNYEYHVIQIYVPSILTVFLSWVNFWLDCQSTPARISLGLLTVLTMTTQSSGARANLPMVSYIKAIDVYLAACLTFVFLGLVEFAYINVLVRTDSRTISESRKTHGHKDKEEKKHRCDYFTDRSMLTCFKPLNTVTRARRLDKISRIVFPTAFLLFNAVYWVYYFYLASEDDTAW